MAVVEKIKNGVQVECDCGLIHKVKFNSESKELKITTVGTPPKKAEVKEEKPTEEISKEEKDFLDMFD